MTGGFAVAPAAYAISAVAAKYRPENPKKLQDQWLKDELGRRPPTVGHWASLNEPRVYRYDASIDLWTRLYGDGYVDRR